jgi:hypothetical protein
MKSLLTSESWLKQAVSHATTKWLREFLLAQLPLLRGQRITPESFADALTELLLTRSLTSLAQQKNYRSNVCQALKSIDPEHPAIPLVSPTTEEYRELNETQRSKLAVRETKYFSSETADLIVERAKALLASAEWSDVAAGLAVLIGRRISEILLSNFAPHTHWSLDFSEMSKKSSSSLTIEIPTLAPAPLVLAAIQRLQLSLQIEDLKADAFSEKTARQTINQRFSLAVTDRCHLHFYDLVPLRTDRENLYTHLFRACYATIAAHWFCPVTVPEHSFKSEIQGHFTISQEGHKLPNFSARANYDDYAICSADGNRDGRLGIKLGLFPNLQVLTVFRNSSTTMAIPSESPKRRRASPDQPTVGQQTLLDPSILTDQPVAAPPMSDRAKLSKARANADDVDLTLSTPSDPANFTKSTMTSSDTSLHQTIQWFTAEIDALRAKVAQLEQERDELRAAVNTSPEIELIQAENKQLRTQLQAIQNLLGIGAEVAVSEAAIPSVAEASPNEAVPAEKSPMPVAHESTLSTKRVPAKEMLPKVGARELSRSPGGRTSRTDTQAALHRIIDALLDWNNRQFDPTQRLRISIPIIKELAIPFGATYQPAIQRVMAERADEIEAIHARLLLGVRHNASVLDKDEIVQSLIQSLQGD